MYMYTGTDLRSASVCLCQETIHIQFTSMKTEALDFYYQSILNCNELQLNLEILLK